MIKHIQSQGGFNKLILEHEKYMSIIEVKILKFVSEIRATVDLGKSRYKGVLSWMVIDLALCTGLRVSEIADIRIEDIDLSRDVIKIIRRKHKGHKTETLIIGKDLTRHLKEYIEWTGRTKGSLFVGQRGALASAGLQQVWKSAIKRAGLPVELSIHSTRHTLAVHLLKKTGNLRQVQKQLGHASPITTAEYCTSINPNINFKDMQDGVTNLYQ